MRLCPDSSSAELLVMRCTTHIRAKRISHWWQPCWSIKGSTFYPENSANSGGQLAPRQPGSGVIPSPVAAVVSRRAALLVADAPLCVLWVWERGDGGRLWLCARRGARRWGAPRGNYAQPQESLHRGIVGIFVYFNHFLSFFLPPKSHKWNIKCTSVARVGLKGAFICILGLAQVGNVITSVNCRHAVSDINMRSIGSERRLDEYSSGLMWMSATDIAVD